MRKNTKTNGARRNGNNNNSSCGPNRNGFRAGGRGYKGTRQEKEDLKSKQPNADKSSNDPSWYAADPQLLRDAASIPFSWAVGTPFKWNNEILKLVEDGKGDWDSIAGICTIDIVPTFGVSNSETSALNLAAVSQYGFVRHANSGSANYDSPDLMIYTMAMSQIYSMLNWMIRAYGIANLYSQRNRYLPSAILKEQGIDFDDMLKNLAQYRYALNILINKAASLATPASMPIFRRAAFMFANLYIEGESMKNQLYQFAPTGFYKFIWDASSAGALKFESRPGYDTNTPMTVDQLITYANGFLDQIIWDEDMNIMSGDILKAYGLDNILKLSTVDENFSILPLYDPVVLEQMKNARVVQVMPTTFNVQQSADKKYLEFIPWFDETYDDTAEGRATHFALASVAENFIITTSAIDPTPELVMEITRLSAYGFNYTRNPDDRTISYNVYCGSEIANRARIAVFDVDKDGRIENLESYWYNYGSLGILLDDDAGDRDRAVYNLRILAAKNYFKFAPAAHCIAFVPGTAPGSVQASQGFLSHDVDNYAVLDVHTMARMHDSAMLSLLNVPSIGKVII